VESSGNGRPQYCDIVMKGGITSGVVYPLAAVELAEKHGYTFRNVGGTSAGAIAAAAVAAAEFGRRAETNKGSYERIKALPDELGERLTSLFQPSPRMRPIFNALLASIGGSRSSKALAPLKSFPAGAATGALPGLALILFAIFLHGASVLRIAAGAAGLLALVVGAYLVVAFLAVRRLRDLPTSYFGLCPGHDRAEDGRDPPLTRWLADLIDDLARKRGGAPLLFGDLWELDAPAGERGVNLQMMTTNLSQGRPYSLPFEAGEEFWFDPDEFLDLFPRRIVDAMTKGMPATLVSDTGRDLHPLPRPEDLPVVVAARMSLSFPGLIGAIPLYALNDAPKSPSGMPERCWFSDGGIVSNFPVHFFDAPIPRWPTFAIDLMPLARDRSLEVDERKNVWMPETNDEGVAEAWVGWEHKPSLGQLSAFGISIFRTAQNWIDNRQMRGAGYRDRIAHVRLAEDEGGMNLKMKSEQVKRLATRGAGAADMLAERFAPEPPAQTKLTWDNQKWIRYRTYMELLERKGREARRGYDDNTLGRPLPVLSSDPPDFPWEAPGQADFADKATSAQLELFMGWGESGQAFSKGAPRPGAEPWSIPRV
jgi:predicted acylesterase/phospholipase RssA